MRTGPITLASGLGFTEGPVLLQDGRVLVTSVDTGTLHWLDRNGGAVAELFVGSAPNGAAEGADGTIYVAQCGSASPIGPDDEAALGSAGGIQAVDRAGHVRWLTTRPTSPNDICIGPDGWVWCTDPTRPLGSDDGRIWRCDPVSGEPQLMAEVPWYPNGIGFGLDDDVLWVAHTTASQIIRFPVEVVDGATRLGDPTVAIQMTHGAPDGFAFDVDGNLVIGTVMIRGGVVRDGDAAQPDPGEQGEVQVWTPDGTFAEAVVPGLGRLVTNVALGSDGMLVATAADAGAAVRYDGWPVAGLPLHPFR